ncbi:MAG: TolC family protein, partial [Planctomycetales bacterium]
EQMLTFEQQMVSTKSQLNRIIGRNADHPISIPKTIQPSLPKWSHDMLRQVAWQQQPEIAAAQLRTQATCWGVQVARLERRPDLSVNATWFAIDDNRPAATTLVDVGRDALSFGVAMNVPLWHQKYDAMEQEAAWKHSASVASVDHVMQRYDSLLRDLWERAITADETAKLYRQTLIPQGRQTLAADQQSYSNGAVEFDRVIRDFRNLLMLELGHHRSIGELASILARIEQAVGTDLSTSQIEALELPAPSQPGNIEPPKPDLPSR